jgi:hypothetical protein
MGMEWVKETVWDCPTCKSPNWRNMGDLRALQHMTQLHHECKCGRWFVAIDIHLARHPRGDDHGRTGKEQAGVCVPRESGRWVSTPDPEPPELPVERVPWIGFRCWRVYPATPVLMPLNESDQASEWLPGRDEFVATCRDHSHAAPAPYCRCGFWGLDDLWEAIGRNPPTANGIRFHWQVIKADLGAPVQTRPILVAGALELSGRLIRGSDGARGERARILALWPVTNATVDQAVQRATVNALARLYKVTVAETWEYLTLLADERRVLYAAADAVEPSEAQA